MIQQILDLSTAHIAQSTAEWLGNESDLILYPKGEYGWFINTASEEFPEDTPPELMDLIQHAKAIDCDWLVLDRDGDILITKPTFDW